MNYLLHWKALKMKDTCAAYLNIFNSQAAGEN